MASLIILTDEEDAHLLLKAHSITYDGYVALTIGKKKVALHRVILNAPEGGVVDHINGDKLDNRKENLRFCTQSQNCMNRRKVKIVTTSKYKGVSFCKQTGSWKAAITWNGSRMTLGRFTKEETAALAYNKAALFYFGEFAYTNTIQSGDSN